MQNKEKFAVGGNKHTYRRRYHLKISEAIIRKVVDAFWAIVADTIADGDKIAIQNYMTIFPKVTTNAKNRYCVKINSKDRLKEACRILNENEKRKEIQNE